MGEARGGRKPRKGNGRIWMGGSGQRSRARTLWQFCPPDVSNWNGLRPFFHFPPPAALTKKRWLGGCHASDLPRSPSTFFFYPLPRLLLHCCVEHPLPFSFRTSDLDLHDLHNLQRAQASISRPRGSLLYLLLGRANSFVAALRPRPKAERAWGNLASEETLDGPVLTFFLPPPATSKVPNSSQPTVSPRLVPDCLIKRTRQQLKKKPSPLPTFQSNLHIFLSPHSTTTFLEVEPQLPT